MTFTNFAALPGATASSILLVLIIGAFTVTPARAEMYKCVQPDGRVLYQQTPCPVGAQKALDAESRAREDEARKQREATLKKAAQDEANREAKALEEVNREFKARAEANREVKQMNEISAETSSISVRGKTIRIGDTADDIFKTLKAADSKKKDVGPDPTNPGSLLVTHHYEVDGKSFSLTLARNPDPGPYRLIRISISSPQKDIPTSSAIAPKENAVDCFDLDLYVKKMNPEFNFMDRLMVVNAARQKGNCK